jgi:hypothetical protein
VQGTGNQFFAGTRFTGNYHRRIGWTVESDLAKDLQDRRADPHHSLENLGCLFFPVAEFVEKELNTGVQKIVTGRLQPGEDSQFHPPPAGNKAQPKAGKGLFLGYYVLGNIRRRGYGLGKHLLHRPGTEIISVSAQQFSQIRRYPANQPPPLLLLEDQIGNSRRQVWIRIYVWLMRIHSDSMSEMKSNLANDYS